MRKIVFFILIFSIFLFAKSTQEISKSVYKIIAKTSNGFSVSTGFVINENGYLITSYSIIKNSISNSLIAINENGKYTNIKGIRGCAKKNIAILKIKDYKSKNFLFLQSPNNIKINDITYAYGYLNNQNMLGQSGLEDENFLTPIIRNGVITRIFSIKSDKSKFPKGSEFLQTSSHINKNNIGGPLVNELGNIIGINAVGKARQEIFWALNIKELMNELDKSKIKYYISNQQIESKSKFDLMLYVLIFAVICLIVIGLFLLLKRKKAYSDDEDISRLVSKKLKAKRREEGTYTLKPFDENLPLVRCENGQNILIGRLDDCDIMIENSYLSRTHCVLENINGELKIKNLSPKNGLFVNNQRLKDEEEKVLIAGDEVVFGSDEVIYKVTK